MFYNRNKLIKLCVKIAEEKFQITQLRVYCTNTATYCVNKQVCCLSRYENLPNLTGFFQPVWLEVEVDVIATYQVHTDKFRKNQIGFANHLPPKPFQIPNPLFCNSNLNLLVINRKCATSLFPVYIYKVACIYQVGTSATDKFGIAKHLLYGR